MALQAKQVAFQAEARSLHAAATLGSVGAGVPYPPSSPDQPPYYQQDMPSQRQYRSPGSPWGQGSMPGGPNASMSSWPSQGDDAAPQYNAWPQSGWEQGSGPTPRHFRCSLLPEAVPLKLTDPSSEGKSTPAYHLKPEAARGLCRLRNAYHR